MLEPGQRIDDRYVVERMLARGGMATVYLVKHEKLHSLHAVKVLDIGTADIRRRLIQEGRLQASLRHPNIVTVTDTLEIDNQPALVMEYVDGPTLTKWLEDNDCSLEQAESLFTQIVSAVGYAHARGLVHRDLKPDNVLMAPMSGTLLPKVADFGIAKVLAEAGAEKGKAHTMTGVALGTPSYMPPEQVASAGEVDHRADIFALGCILYEMVCGKQAFSGDSLLQVFARIAEGDYEPPEKTSPGLPKRFTDAIRGALEADPARRIPDCESLLAVLRGDKEVPAKGKAPKRKPEPEPEPERAKSGWGLWLAAAGVGFGGVASVTAIAAVGALVIVMAGVAVGAWYMGRTGAAPVIGVTAVPMPVPGGVVAPTSVPIPSSFPGGPGVVAPPVPGIVAYTPSPVSGVAPSAPPTPAPPLPEAVLTVPTPHPAPAPVPPGATTPIGRTAEVGGWAVTVHGARTADRVSESVFKHAAGDGEVLVLVDVTIERRGSSDESPFFPSKIIGPWGDEFSTVLACEMALPKGLDASSTFAPGEARRGEACFHVPTAQKGLIYRFKPDMMEDDAVLVPLPL